MHSSNTFIKITMHYFQIGCQWWNLLASNLHVSFSDITNNLNIRNHLKSVWYRHYLTHWSRVTHICVGKLTIIGSDNGLSPGRRQGIIWTNAGILLIGPLATNFSQILIEIHIFSFKKMYLKMSSGNLRPFCFFVLTCTELSSTPLMRCRGHFIVFEGHVL